jgi:hypothetical protein
MRRLRWFASCPALLVGFLCAPAYSGEPGANDGLRTFLGARCVTCHGSDVKKGGLDLESLSTDFKNPAVFEKWVRIHDRIQAGEMPPQGAQETAGAGGERGAPQEPECRTQQGRGGAEKRRGSGRAAPPQPDRI